MVLKFDLKKLLASIVIPLGIGGLATLITKDDMDIYKEIVKPPLSPPGALFPIVWTILYILMGVSLYFIWTNRDSSKDKTKPVILFAAQLLLNFIWIPVFFSAKQFTVAVFILVALLVTLICMTVSFYKIDKRAALLQIPYIIWLCIAFYLNVGVAVLN